MNTNTGERCAGVLCFGLYSWHVYPSSGRRHHCTQWMRPFTNLKMQIEGLNAYFCPYKTIAVRICGRSYRKRKQSSSQSLQQLTAGQMGGRQSPGFELLWHSYSCPLPPATVFDCQPVTCMVIQGLGQASDRAVIWRMNVCASWGEILFSRQHLEFALLKNSHVELMSFPRLFQKEPTAAPAAGHLSSSGHPRKL